MKILIDECAPFKLSQLLHGHSVYSVQMMKWAGVKNGELIKIADEKFDLFITIDKNLKYQQNLSRIRMAIVLIEVNNNRIENVLKAAATLPDLLNSIETGKFYII